MSGSSLGNWPVPNNQLELAKKQAKLVNCPYDTPANIIKCLKSKTAKEIADTLPEFKEFGLLDPCVIWLPVIEQDFGQQRFLTAHPVELVLSDQVAKVPFLTGVTTDGFVNHVFPIIDKNYLLTLDLNWKFDKYAPIVFLYERDTNNSKAISSKLCEFYLEYKSVENSLSGLIQLYGDAIVGFGVNRAAKLLADNSNESVYYYRFNYKGKHSFFYLPDTSNAVPISSSTDSLLRFSRYIIYNRVPYGITHGDDLNYLFGLFTDHYKENDPDTNTIEKMTALWGNFVKTGKPIPEPTEKLDNVKWEPFTPKAQKYLDIGNKLVLNENLNEKRYAEWEKLFPLSKYQGEKNEKQHG